MNFLRRILKSIKKESSDEAFCGANEHKLLHLFCGIGESEIRGNEISITDYPFEPSVAYPNKVLSAKEINAICVDFGVCKIHLEGDIVLVSAEKKEELKAFAERNIISLWPHCWNWDWILELYLDTEFDSEHQAQVAERLRENGIEKHEIDEIRQEVGRQMFKYNFDTMLWEWTSLGLHDVLSAMRAKINKAEFRDFYKRALEIEKRRVNTSI